MKASIVTLSFNQYPFLRQAMDSVLQQGYPELDYIVVDPGSADGSRDLIRSFGGGISHAVFEPDDGPADGLNKGFALASGDIFGFLNADDLLLPDALRRVAAFFEQHPECDLAVGNGYIIDGKGNNCRHVRARSFTVQGYLYGRAAWLQQSVFFRSAIYRRSPGFNPLNRTCWDGELFVRMMAMGARVGYISADLACFRIHPASISGSATNGREYRNDRRRIFGEIAGRGWRPSDELCGWVCRGENAIRGFGARFSRLRGEVCT